MENRSTCYWISEVIQVQRVIQLPMNDSTRTSTFLFFNARRHVGSQKVGDVVLSHFTRAIRRDHSKRFVIKAKKYSTKKHIDAVKTRGEVETRKEKYAYNDC